MNRSDRRDGKGSTRGLLGFCLLCLGGIALGVVVFLLRKDSGFMVAFADGMLVPGVVFLAVSGVVWVRELGGFDTLGYAMRSLTLSFVPGARIRAQSFSEYKKTKKSRAAVMKRLLAVGLLFFLPALILSLAAL